jgi:hypothetical protein
MRIGRGPMLIISGSASLCFFGAQEENDAASTKAKMGINAVFIGVGLLKALNYSEKLVIKSLGISHWVFVIRGISFVNITYQCLMTND